MQIQLKQLEILAALGLYLNSQGINTTGKEVTINFTSGRKNKGLIADITIGEPKAVAEVPQVAVVEAVVAVEPEAAVDAEEVSEAAPAKAVSLFN